VIDEPEGDDDSLRPNQIFAVSLPQSPLTATRQKQVVDTCGQMLLTSYGLRSLSPNHPDYAGYYRGNSAERDRVYHQGTVWDWQLGAFALAHWQVYGSATQAHQFLEPMANHPTAHGMGSLTEIFNSNAPMKPEGRIAQAWTVAELLRAWLAIEDACSTAANVLSSGF